VLPAERASYVMGNPPFVGAKFMDDAQRADTRTVFDGIANAGLLDFVAAWYVKAARYIQGQTTRCAFVSTNSITQGEQVGALWGWLLAQGVKIHFAHRTFSWSNEARGKAAVHCVIVGFGLGDVAAKTIYEYEDIRGEPHAVAAANINPYLVDAPDVVLPKRGKPISDTPEIKFGNQPIDGGHLILTDEERIDLLRSEPDTAPYVRLFLGADEFINGATRYCLWLKEAPPTLLRNSPFIRQRLEAVRNFRLESKRDATRELATTPAQFAFVSHPSTPYLLFPSVSSERRDYIPIGFMPAEVIASNLCLIVPHATSYHFGVLTSAMHMAWVRSVCGRLKSDYRYSAGIVYNNFPWPLCSSCNAGGTVAPSDKLRQSIETAAQAVLDARAAFPDATLADLYDPLSMPSALLKAHQKLDTAVDKAYGKTGFKSDAERVAFLFARYQTLTSLLPVAALKRSRKKPAVT